MNIKIATIFAALCLASVANAEPCKLVRNTSVDMTLDSSHGVLVPITIDGQPFTFLVDTGGVYSMVTESTVDKLGIPLRKQVFTEEMGFGGELLTNYVVANHVVFGGLNAYRFNFVVLPDTNKHDDMQGILAPDVLGANDVDFDFANKKFSLFSRDHCYGGVVYWTSGYFAQIPFKISEDHHIELPVTLDGKDMRGMIDTGSTNTIMSLEYAEQLFGIDPKSPDLKPLEAKEGEPHFYRYPFKMLSFGAVTVTNPRVLLVSDSESRIMAGTEPPIIVGMSILTKLHLYIAYGEHNLYVTGADAH